MSTALITIGIFIALIAGFFAGRWHGMSQRSKQLSEELEQKEEELNALKSNVNDHFSETARLFTNLTEEYKSLYKHLAKGATELSDESFKLTLAAPNETLIDHEPEQESKLESETDQDDDGQPATQDSDIQADEEKVGAKQEELQQPVDYYKESDENESADEESTEDLEPNKPS
ncbi:MAG: DUF1043 family protein [Gammaproteobacteria bacterium]|nr:DUF1043 family protein [Gammaproteobacteria bacterium]